VFFIEVVITVAEVAVDLLVQGPSGGRDDLDRRPAPSDGMSELNAVSSNRAYRYP
jgi:hypothetical protein